MRLISLSKHLSSAQSSPPLQSICGQARGLGACSAGCESPWRKAAGKQRKGLYQNASWGEAAEALGSQVADCRLGPTAVSLRPRAPDQVLLLRHPVGAAGTARPCEPSASRACGSSPRQLRTKPGDESMLVSGCSHSCARNEATFSKRRNQNGSNTHSADEDGNIYYFSGALNFPECPCAGPADCCDSL